MQPKDNTTEDLLIHAGFDLVEAKAKHRRDLEWIRRLLNDAKDAMEIGEPDIAKRRIEAAINYTKREGA